MGFLCYALIASGGVELYAQHRFLCFRQTPTGGDGPARRAGLLETKQEGRDTMKKRLIPLLLLAFILPLLAMPSQAASEVYDYQTVSVDCDAYYGYNWCKVRFTFDKAAVGYQFTYQSVFNCVEEDGGFLYIYNSVDADTHPEPVIILKDNSRMKVEILEGEFEGLPAGQADSTYYEYALFDFSPEGNPVLSSFVGDSSWRPTEPVSTGTIEQMFRPKDGATVALYLRNEVSTWLIKESDAKLFKVEKAGENSKDVSIHFSNGTQNDAGVSYDYKLTNTTGETINGYYALLSYSPSYNTVRGGVSAQLHTFDVTLKPGESAAGTLNSNFWELSRYKLIWIQFDDKADRDAFLSNRALVGDFGRYVVDSDRGAQWLKDNFDITLNPAK